MARHLVLINGGDLIPIKDSGLISIVVVRAILVKVNHLILTSAYGLVLVSIGRQVPTDVGSPVLINNSM